MSGPQQAPPGQRVTVAFGDGDGNGPLFDIGNTLLATSVPHDVTIGKIPVPGGELGIVTIHTTTTTLTITLTRGDAQHWIDAMTVLRDKLSGAGLQVAGSGSRLIVPGR